MEIWNMSVINRYEYLVCRLKHSIYGLKQSARCWNSTLDTQLKKMGLVQTTSDPCLYVASEGEIFIIAVYVDDLLLAGTNEKQMNEIKRNLAKQFRTKDMGELHYFLGVNVIHDRNAGTIWIGQPTYAENLLRKYGMENAKTIDTPVEGNSKLVKTQDDSECVDTEMYQSAVGSLLYLSIMTRPDLTFAVSNVAKFCAMPGKQHWTAVKRVMRYLKGTLNYGLKYCKMGNNHVNFIGYSDADWGGDVNDYKSTSGYIFQIGGTAVSWRSKKQTCVALSTAEAEYIALAGAAQEAIWMRRLIADLRNEQSEATVIYEDNQSTICMAKNPQFHSRTKHIGIKYHYVREQVLEGTITLEYCPTENMIADIFTKGLNKEKFVKLREMAGVKIYK
jgi:hypothetical protein